MMNDAMLQGTRSGWWLVVLLPLAAMLSVGCDEEPEDAPQDDAEAKAHTTDQTEDESDDGGGSVSRSRQLSSSDPIVKAAEQKYIAAYNAFTSLIHAGKGDTVEGQKAHAAYLQAREEYNKLLEKVKPPDKH
jgi:hypothetical protein